MNRGSSDKPSLTMARSVPGFNEAPIHESGKYPNICWKKDTAPDHASMRPRFMNRGSESTGELDNADTQLQ